MNEDTHYLPFSFTKEQFQALLLAHSNKDAQMHQSRASQHFPFKHWEADVLVRMFEASKDDPEAQALLAALMEACERLVLMQRADKALALV